MKLTLTAAGAKLTADGSLTKPLQGKGYNLAVNGTIPDAAALTPLLQGTILPPLHDVTFAAKVADTGTGIAGILGADAACRCLRPERTVTRPDARQAGHRRTQS